jgi:hypothetical protein
MSLFPTAELLEGPSRALRGYFGGYHGADCEAESKLVASFFWASIIMAVEGL